jgi:acyl carrier protein
VANRQEVSAAVRDMLLARWPGRFSWDELADHVQLGKDGLGLDSIEIVELLLELEEQIPYGGGAEELLDAGPITIRDMIDHISRPRRERSPGR